MPPGTAPMPPWRRGARCSTSRIPRCDERGRGNSKTRLRELTYGYYANSLLKSIASSNTDGVRLGYRYDEANRLAFVDDTTEQRYTYFQLYLQPEWFVGNHDRTERGRPYLRLRQPQSSADPRRGERRHDPAQLRIQTACLRSPPASHRRRETTTYTYDDLYRLTSEAISGTGCLACGFGRLTPSTKSVTGKLGYLRWLLFKIRTNTFNSRDWLSATPTTRTATR